MKLADRVAIVTGAAQGIGRAIAEKLDAEGASVVIADLNARGAQQAASALERGSRDRGRRLLGAVGRRDGRRRARPITAGSTCWSTTPPSCPSFAWEDVDLAHWKKIIDTNLTGVYLCSRAVWGPMREAGYGRITNIASNTVMAGTPNMAAYVAAKGGVWGFTRALATELGGQGITVNAVAPGLTASDGVLASPHAEAFDFVQSLQAIPRRGEPADIAPTVAFLCSEEAAWVTGQMIVVDGGHTRH